MPTTHPGPALEPTRAALDRLFYGFSFTRTGDHGSRIQWRQLNGFGVATIFPAGEATPPTANINAGANCYAISNLVTVGLGTGADAGKLSIVWGGGGAVPDAHAFLDVTAYIL